MNVKKTLLATAMLAMASTPAWALPAGAETNGSAHRPASTPVGPPESTPNYSSNPGSANRSKAGGEHAGGGEQGKSHSAKAGSHSNHAGGNGKAHSNGNGQAGSEHGKSHKCKPHNVGYIAAGALVTWTLNEEEGSKHHAYEGEVTVEVKRTNHHASADKGETVTYQVKKAHVHGSVSVEDLAAGDRVRVIGKITKLAKKCETAEGEFTPTIEVRRLIFHAPQTTTTTTTTSTTSTS